MTCCFLWAPQRVETRISHGPSKNGSEPVFKAELAPVFSGTGDAAGGKLGLSAAGQAFEFASDVLQENLEATWWKGSEKPNFSGTFQWNQRGTSLVESNPFGLGGFAHAIEDICVPGENPVTCADETWTQFLYDS